MELLSFIAIATTSLWVSNLWDYIVFSTKHRETQSHVNALNHEISSLTHIINNLSNEVRENNTLIRELNKNATHA